ncbi:MAG: transposase [Magnetococcales bacterium]|nr:transposase [Magnetococcales bacterium]
MTTQSNSKIEHWHKTIKGECIRPGTPLSLEDAQRIVGLFVEDYNTVRLHSAIGYVTPADRLAGRHEEIHSARDRKLEEARAKRAERRNRVETSGEQGFLIPDALASSEERAVEASRAYATLVSSLTEDRAMRGRNPSAVQGPKQELELEG